MTEPDLEIRYRPPGELISNPRNARTHARRQVRQIADSIATFGFTNPVLVDGAGQVLAGHGRLAAARLLGLTSVPTVRLDHMSAEQRRAYVIADNRLAEKAGWDRGILAIELGELSALDLDFAVEITGFEPAEIDLLIGETEQDGKAPDDADQLPAVDDGAAPVSQPGDLWCLGQHRLLCGDARDRRAYVRLMAGTSARMLFTDPPYNVAIDGHVSGRGRIRHREFAMASGEMTDVDFTGFLGGVFRHLARHSLDGALQYICMDWRHAGALIEAGETVYGQPQNLCVWVKSNAGMGSLYRSRHELVFVFKAGRGRHVNNVELGRHGRYRSNVWEYPGASALASESRALLALHPTVKPVALVADAILDASRRGEVVLDPFAGSGTTLIAAEKVGRIGRLMEIDPVYADLIVRRWQDWSGEPAIHEASGLSFAQIAEQARDAGKVGSDGPAAEACDVR